MCIPLHNKIALLKRITGYHFQCVYMKPNFKGSKLVLQPNPFRHRLVASGFSTPFLCQIRQHILHKLIYPINCTLLSIALFTSKYNIGFYSNIIIPSTITFPKQRVRRLQTKSKTKFTMKMFSI